MPRPRFASLFVEAAARGNAGEVMKSVETGQDINSLHELLGHSALHAAAEFGHLHIVKFLIENGAKVNITSQLNHDTPLHRSCSAGRYQVAQYLLSKGADKLMTTLKRDTAIDLAVAFKKMDIALMLGDPPEQAQGRGIEATETSLTIECSVTSNRHLPPVIYEACCVKVVEIDDETRKPDPHEVLTSERVQLPITQWQQQNYECTKTDGHKPIRLTLRNLEPSAAYAIRVRASNTVGFGEFGSIFTFETISSIPACPQDIQLNEATSRTLRMSWKPSKPHGFAVSVYEVRYQQLADEATAVEQASPWEVVNMKIVRTSVTIDYLMPDTVHAISLRARNDKGWGPWSNGQYAQFRTDRLVAEAGTKQSEHTTPNAPCRVYPIQTSATSVLLRWYPPANCGHVIDKYEVRKALVHDTGQSSKEAIVWEASVPDITDTCFEYKSLGIGDAYVYSVRAHNSQGWSDFSVVAPEDAFKTTDELPEAPELPICVTKTETSIELEWTMPTAAEKSSLVYELRMLRQTEPRGEALASPTLPFKLRCIATGIQRQRFTVTDLIPATTYLFTLRARSKSGKWGHFSSLQDVNPITTLDSPPFAPYGPDVKQSTATSITVEWQEPDGNGSPIQVYELVGMLQQNRHRAIPASVSQRAETTPECSHPALLGYVASNTRGFVSSSFPSTALVSPVGVQYAKESSNWYCISDNIDSTCREFTVSNLLPNTSYCFALRAKNQVGWGPLTPANSIAVACTERETPAAPVGFSATTSKTSIRVRWDCPRNNGASIDSFRAQVFEKQDPVSLPPETCSCVFNGLDPGVFYTISIQAHNAFGWGQVAQIQPRTQNDIPDTPAYVAILGSKQTLLSVEWQAPNCRGAEIERYELQCRIVEENYVQGHKLEIAQDWDTVSDQLLSVSHAFDHCQDGKPLFSGTCYQIRLRALNQVGWSGYSNPTDFPACRIVLNPSAPYPPPPPTATSISTTSIALKWQCPEHTGGDTPFLYELQMACISCSEYHSYQQEFVNEAAYVEPVEEEAWRSLEDNLSVFEFTCYDLRFHPYVYRVRAKNVYGWGAFSLPSRPYRLVRRF